MLTIDQQCEKFMGGPFVAYSERVWVTIDHRGRIFLNQKAYKMMGSPRAVYLYFNRPKNMIIIEKTECLTGNDAFTVKDAGGTTNTGRAIRASTFIRHFLIRVTGTQSFTDPQFDSKHRLYLKLHETVGVTNRKKKAD